MVLLTITPAIDQALRKAYELAPDELSSLQRPSEPNLLEPTSESPISHSQLIDLSKLLKQRALHDEESTMYSLDTLLRGSRLYIPPPPPKKEPTPEFKALMARLRHDEEARAYERMVNPPLVPESYAQRYPTPSFAQLDPREAALADDDVSYEEVNRQIILIINVLVSIIACSVFIWVAARHWSAPKRLGLSMCGSGVVAIAEVVIYSGYVRKVKEAKEKEKKKPEIKEIIESWIIDGANEGEKSSRSSTLTKKIDDGIRHRKGKHP